MGNKVFTEQEILLAARDVVRSIRNNASSDFEKELGKSWERGIYLFLSRLGSAEEDINAAFEGEVTRCQQG